MNNNICLQLFIFLDTDEYDQALRWIEENGQCAKDDRTLSNITTVNSKKRCRKVSQKLESEELACPRKTVK